MPFTLPKMYGPLRATSHRTAFLLESLQDLDEQLRAKGSRLFVVRGKPEEVLPGLFHEWKVNKLTFEADSEPRSRERDREVGVSVGLRQACVMFCVSMTTWLLAVYRPEIKEEGSYVLL